MRSSRLRFSGLELNFLILGLIFGEIAAWPIFMFGLSYRLRLIDIVIGLFLISLLPRLRHLFKKTELRSFIVLSLVLFLTNLFGSLGLFHSQLISLLYWLRWSVYVLVGLSLFYAKINWKWFLDLSFFYILISLIQYFFINQIGYYNLEGWDPHAYRLFGSLFDPNFYGLILFFLFFAFDSFSFPNQANLKHIVRLILLILMILTLSRTIYLILIFYGFYKFKLWYQNRQNFKVLNSRAFIYLFTGLIMFLVIGWMSLSLSGEGVKLWRLSTVVSRWDEFKTALNIWQQHWLIGIGFNNIKLYKLKFLLADVSSHSLAWFSSSVSTVLVTSGLVGLLVWGWFLVKLYKVYNHQGRFLLLIFLFHSQFHSSLFYSFTLINFFIVQSIINNKSDKLKPS